jgi:hypothetical protein
MRSPSVASPLRAGPSNPWAVTEELVRHLNDTHLRDVMRDLLVAESYRTGADVSKAIVNAETKASDEGEDGTSAAAPKSQTWLSDVVTCWQLKAGVAGQPAKLRNEITKPKPAATLRAGGRFVVVASAAVDGAKGIASRKAILLADAKKARLPTGHVDVYTSEQLASWINEHPAIAAGLRGVPQGFSLLRDWENYPSHRDPWVSSTALDAKLDQLRRATAFDVDKPTVHTHIFGPPGVGKTRFVLEACRRAPWAKTVLYVPQYAIADVTGILAAASRAGVGQLALVVDEVPLDQVKALAAHAFAAPDRLRVISIGHHASPDTEVIGQLEVERLDDQTMTKMIQTAHPTMHAEQVRYVVNFADGFTRLARMAAHAVDADPDMHTAELLVRGDIKQLMDSMLGDEDRQPLHVLALLSSVGWSGARADEGRSIAQHLRLDWAHVQSVVQ